VDYRIDPDERAKFKRCRRQWDFASPHRRDLEPTESAENQLTSAVKDALAVYYYPGTWDWQHDLKQSLVHKSLERSLSAVGAPDMLATATTLLNCYDAWAVSLDDFAPVKIDHDVAGLVTDPRETDRALLAPNGFGVVYGCRVDLLAVDAHDEYWVLRHQIVDAWQASATLVRDEEAIAACWAWEQDYMGMQVAGTIHNEVLITGPFDIPTAGSATRIRVAQHEPSGGGRSIPVHRRAAAAVQISPGSRFEQRTAGILRRTRIRRSRGEIGAAAAMIAMEALEMTDAPAIYPNPAQHCEECAFTAPCLAMFAGSDPQPVLSERFRRRPPVTASKPRLGQATWGFGRGAAPPHWSG
jgi:hypothetical protein